ncbi:hypothetical protein FOPE_06045 [Fonsecaea pedrosoi]|nr:hypothetical protein FOPE_06045 [Fonsecaea pedrosoi]
MARRCTFAEVASSEKTAFQLWLDNSSLSRLGVLMYLPRTTKAKRGTGLGELSEDDGARRWVPLKRPAVLWNMQHRKECPPFLVPLISKLWIAGPGGQDGGGAGRSLRTR